jgi:hypothetical protein
MKEKLAVSVGLRAVLLALVVGQGGLVGSTVGALGGVAFARRSSRRAPGARTALR